jgi:hypothetical protein
MEDPDTQKPDCETIMSTSVTMTSFPVKIRGVYHDTKTSPATTAGSHKKHRGECNGFQRVI